MNAASISADDQGKSSRWNSWHNHKTSTSGMVWSVFSFQGPGHFFILEGATREEQYIKSPEKTE